MPDPAAPENIVKLPNNWRPRPYQMKLWRYLEHGGLRGVAVWHRRAGKDDICLHWAAVAAHQKVGNYWHMLPMANQARKAIWDAVNPRTGRRRIDEAFPRELRETTREQDMMIRFKNGSSWQVVGSDNYDSLVGSTPVGIVFSEFALADPQSWAYLRPILLENGGWALFIYTPRGRNHGATFYETTLDDPQWYCERLRADQTGVFTSQQLEVEREEYTRQFGRDDGESRYMQEYFCDFNVPVVGSFYGSFMRDLERQNRITNVPHDPALPVETWWDLGVDDFTAIWFVQRTQFEYRFIDYYESHSKALDHYARILDEYQRENDWVYSYHLWPHDGAGRDLSKSDAEGFAMQRNEVMAELGYEVEIMPRDGILEGIDAARRVLRMSWFDVKKCARGIEALMQYRREWDEKKMAFQEKPLHDWASHAADAYRTGAQFKPHPFTKTTYPENHVSKVVV